MARRDEAGEEVSDPEREARDAARAAAEDDPAAHARAWLLSSTAGTLGTLCAGAGMDGWPFGSIVPFALDAHGRPLLLLAGIAAHTKNLRADARASLFVHERRDDDPQAGWRITVMGRARLVATHERAATLGAREAEIVAREELEEIEARYRERVPQAPDYLATHDFDFWRLSVDKVRYIKGFGKICWIEGAHVVRDPGGHGVREASAGVIAHMNADHEENMREMCRGLHGFSPQAAQMVAVDRGGFLLRSQGPDRLVSFSFGREVEAAGLRRAIIDVLQRARVAQEA
jgi:heme iron utilization protein